MKNFFTKYKKDLILIFLIFSAALVLFFVFELTKKTGAVAEISVNGKLIDSVSLSKNTEKTYGGENGAYNKVIVENGTVYVADADCRDHLCMIQGKKSQSGETIICLPHRFVVTIREAGDSVE